MKTIEVVAAIIIKDGHVFATQRGYGEFKGWWDLPRNQARHRAFTRYRTIDIDMKKDLVKILEGKQ